MKEQLLKHIDSEIKINKEIQYARNQAQAFIIEGQIQALTNMREIIEKMD